MDLDANRAELETQSAQLAETMEKEPEAQAFADPKAKASLETARLSESNEKARANRLEGSVTRLREELADRVRQIKTQQELHGSEVAQVVRKEREAAALREESAMRDAQQDRDVEKSTMEAESTGRVS